MKNKKGYTLIEVIIAISLIIVIGSISIISIKKTEDNPDEEKTKYVEKVKLDAAVYFENNKDIQKFANLTEVDDWAIIQLKDLIAEGLLDENLYNPERKVSSGDFEEDCVKIFLDDELNIDIEYPVEGICKEQTKEQITENLSKLYIYINKDNETTNIVTLEDSYNMYQKYGNAFSLSDEDYIKENFVDPKAVIKDYDGNIYGTIEGEYSFNNTTKEVIYTYSVNESNMYYSRIDDKSVERRVKLKDSSGPIIIGYGYAYPENSYVYFDFPQYSGYMDFWTMYYNIRENYSTFDNKDGFNSFDLEEYYDYYYLDTFNWASNYYMFNQIELEDSNRNKTNYNIEIYPYYNEPPYIWYDESYNYFYDYEIYTSNNEIYPIYEHIYVDDWDSPYYSYYYYLIDDYGNYYDAWNTSYLSSGNYTLYIEAYDDYNWTSASYNIYIDYYYYYDPWYDPYYDPYYDSYYDPYYGYDDYYCGDACIIEQMQQNSEAWWGASPEEQDRLHEENEWLAGQLSGDTYYTDDGYWHNDDGSYLYGDDYYGYDSYYDYGYDDYYDYGYYDYYDCCWY